MFGKTGRSVCCDLRSRSRGLGTQGYRCGLRGVAWWVVTAPIWMALPPEVHSALLSSGPGPGSLLAAAGAWNSLSVEYASVAEELSAVVASVQAGVWEGSSAELYAAANVPYVAWLMQASANSAAAAVQHETAAAAYTSALAAMPTLGGLAANHATHAVLLATNFFGINTIPIALNEADYARMWIQAATTMTTYQAVASSAVAATPQTTPAPRIVKSNATVDLATASYDPTPNLNNADNIFNLLNFFSTAWQAAELDEGGAPSMWLYQIYLGLFVYDPADLAHVNPALLGPVLLSVVSQTLFWRLVELFELIQMLPQLIPQLLTVALSDMATSVGAVASLGAASGLAGLAGLAGLPTGAETFPAPAVVPAATAPTVVSPVPTLAAPPATAPTPTPAPAPATAPAAGAPPPPPAGPGGFPYLVGGLNVRSRTSAEAKAREPKSDAASAAASVVAAATTREHTRACRRRRAGLRGYGEEFMDMNIQLDPDWGAPPIEEPVASTVPSDHGAGPVGFAGTVPRETVTEAAGLTTLADDEFDGGPTTPMLPGTWNPRTGEARERTRPFLGAELGVPVRNVSWLVIGVIRNRGS